MTDALRLHDLTLGYDGHPAVLHLDGAFAEGSMTAIVGPNGSGKSTLLKGLVGALRPLGGSVARSAQAIAYLPQSAEIDRSFPATVAELVGLGFWRERGPFRGIGRVDRDLLGTALGAVGLEGFARRPIDTLSGGQMQRALFARVLLEDAPMVLLDEPFTAVDEKTIGDLLRLVSHWHTEGRTIIAVLHDLELVRRFFPETLLIAREKIGWGATPEILTTANLVKARAMPEAWDDRAQWQAENPLAHEEYRP